MLWDGYLLTNSVLNFCLGKGVHLEDTVIFSPAVCLKMFKSKYEVILFNLHFRRAKVNIQQLIQAIVWANSCQVQHSADTKFIPSWAMICFSLVCGFILYTPTVSSQRALVYSQKLSVAFIHVKLCLMLCCFCCFAIMKALWCTVV